MNDLKIIGIVVALEKECVNVKECLGNFLNSENYAGINFETYVNNNIKFIVGYSGVGEIQSTITTTLLIEHFKSSLIINFGLCGSLSKNAKLGDVLIPNKIVHYDYNADTSDPNREGIYLGRKSPFFKIPKNNISDSILNYKKTIIASGDKFIAESNFKNHIFEKFGCEICDMESAGINLVCEKFNIDRIFIKAVSDNADDEANETFEDAIRYGVDAYKKILHHIVNQLNNK